MEDFKKQFPSNAHKDKERPKIEKVVTGKVTVRKKPLTKRIFETFVGEEGIDNVFGYLIHDVLVPAAKNTISEMVQGGIEMMLFGERKSNRNSFTRNGGHTYINYGTFANKQDGRRNIPSRAIANYSFGEITFQSRGEAEEVLSNLVDLIMDYGEATVKDLYDYAGIEGDYTARNYGWMDLSSSRVDRVRDGYIIILPKPILLER